MRNQFAFHGSYYEAAKALPKKERVNVILAVCGYALDGEEPELDGLSKAVFELIRPQLDSDLGAEAKRERSRITSKRYRDTMRDTSGDTMRDTLSDTPSDKTPPSSPLKPPNNPQKERVSKDTPKKKTPKPPTLAEVEAYCKERGSNVDPKDFWDFYEAGDWVDSKGKPVLAWKQKLITWEKHQPSSPIKGGEDAHAESEHTLAPPKRWHKTGDFEGYWEVQNEQGEWVKRDA